MSSRVPSYLQQFRERLMLKKFERDKKMRFHQRTILLRTSYGKSCSSEWLQWLKGCHTQYFHTVSQYLVCVYFVMAAIQNFEDQFRILDEINNLKEDLQKLFSDVSRDVTGLWIKRFKEVTSFAGINAAKGTIDVVGCRSTPCRSI